jgi:hypothetical protein
MPLIGGASAFGTTFNIASYGALGDSKLGYSCEMTAGSASLVCQDVSFASTDVGRRVAVYGANSSSYYVSLDTTIKSVSSSSTATLSTAASKTVSVTMAQVVGRDNVGDIQNAINAACRAASAGNPSTVEFPNGVYAVSAGVQVPAGCSYVNLEAQNSGDATLLGTYISSSNSSKRGYGQGGSVLFFGSTSAPGTGTDALSNNVTIAAGSNVLTCAGCKFSSSSAGKPIYVEYAGANRAPLWSTITSVASASEVTLANDAESSLPLNPTGLIADPAVVFGYEAIKNIDVGGINIQNVGYYYKDGFTTLGVPLVEFGAGAQVVKQNVSFHDSTMISATNGCTGNNGPNDGFTFKNLTCQGAQDTAYYLAGFSTNGTIENVVVDNTHYPIAKTALWNAFLLKGITNVTIENATVRCYCKDFLVDFGDLPSFNDTIENSNLNGEGVTPVGIGSNLLSGLTVTNTTIQGINGNAFRFVNAQAKGISGITMTDNIVLDANGAIWTTDGSSSGHGPANMKFQNNTAQVSGNAINIQKSEGTNYWTGNQLTNTDPDHGWAWAISDGASGATNYLGSNTATNFRPGSSSCQSCKTPPSN